jgi:putative alpha-1,2-mannosidase
MTRHRPTNRRHTRLLAAIAVFMTLALVAWGVALVLARPPAGHPHAQALAAQNPAALVDPFVGTCSGGQTEGGINSFPGAGMPFGMTQWRGSRPDLP